MSTDGYVKLKLIGKGNYGEAWLVKNKHDRKKYVLKSVDLRFADEKERIGARQEAELLSQLKHPNIVAYKESFTTPDGYLCIAMGFCEGGDLYHRLRQQNGVLLAEQQVGEWFVQISMAIKYMHDRHILHRDLKTQNIFLTKSEIIKVGDLGIARVLENSNALATTMIGTPYYMSPELFSNEPYGYKSDVWALGCCIYEMMTLRHAFDAKSFDALAFRIVRGKLPPMPAKYSTGLLNLVKMMLQKDQKRRPTIEQILGDLYIKEQIREFLNKTQKKQLTDSANQQRQIRNSSSISSFQSDDSNLPKTKAKDNFSKNEVNIGPELERIDEEDRTAVNGADRTIKPKRYLEAEPKNGEQSERRVSGDNAFEKKTFLVTKPSVEKVKQSSSQKMVDNAPSESKRDRRRKKKRAELQRLVAKSDKIADKKSGEDDETQAPMEIKSKQSTDISMPTTNENIKPEHQSKLRLRLKPDRPSTGNRKEEVETVHFIGNSVFYHKEIESFKEIDQGTITLHSEVSHQQQSVPSDRANGFQERNVGRRKSSSDKENGVMIVQNDDEADSSSKKSLDCLKLKSSFSSPQLKSTDDLKLRSTGSPKMKSKVKIARKLSDETVRHASPLSFERVERRTNEIPPENPGDTEEMKRKVSEDSTHRTDQSSALKRPLPPRPGHSAIEPTESQFSRKLSPSATQVQSNGNPNSTSSSSSSASSARSSKDENMEVLGNLNSSSRRRRRKMKEKESSHVRRSFDNAVLLSSDEINVNRTIGADDDETSSDEVDGNFIRKNPSKVSRSLDIVNSLASEFLSDYRELYVNQTPPRNSFSTNGKDVISVVDDLESASSESSAEGEMEMENIRVPRHKEIKNFISLLCSTLLINEKKSVDLDRSDSEVDEVEGKCKPLADADGDTMLFIRRPLPSLNDSNTKFKDKGYDTNDKLPSFHDEDAYEATGRLFERITALRTDCLRGLGRRKLDAALKLIENFETEETEVQMIKLLGYEDFASYAGKIWQLKYCMEHAFSPRQKQNLTVFRS